MNRFFKATSSSSALLLCLMATAGCKKNIQTSETKSLDNFAAGPNAAFTFNSCSGTNQVTVNDSRLIGSSNQKLAMRSALSAVPVELQTAFFDKLNGTISVVKDINSACKTSEGEAGTKDATLACWQPGLTDAQIYIKAEPSEADTIRNIRHSVVRSMGYILTEVVVKVKQTPEGTKLEENAAFNEVKATIANALVKDIKANKSLQLPASYSTNRSAFDNGAFAESFDSWYCSTESQAKMAAGFPETHKLFVEVAAELPAGLTASGTNLTSGDKAEFGMWGRWGGGNGPIRQGLSNWGNFRAEGGGLMNFRRFNNGGGLVFQRPWFNPYRWQR